MRMDRRALLAGLGGGAALALLGAATRARAARLGAIGLQLYTVRELFAKDPVGTLEQVAGIGYREVEFGGGGYDMMDHVMLRRTMDRLKLRAPSIHLSYEMLLDRFDAALKMARSLGADTIVVPFLTEERRAATEFGRTVRNLNRFGADLHKAGVGLAYHNHEFEFTERLGGVSLFERMVNETDPALLKVELDIFWAVHAGEDPAALIDRLGSRLYAFHVKDRLENRGMTAVGLGTIDFAALFGRPGAAGVRHFYVENDEAPAPYIPDITTSFQTLRALRF